MSSHKPDNRDQWLKADDPALLKECRLDFFKATGKGGQKRNKSSSAVRIIHIPTGIAVTDCSERSQHRNRQVALKKLRVKIAVELRLENSCPPPRMDISPKHQDYPLWIAYILDILSKNGYKVKESATELQLNTAKFVKLLARDPYLWQLINSRRMAMELPPIKK
ncbi:peptide chain release factor-like protein [Lentisphaerota bacterium ZTH]|nr:peptide chain release factor-like protein [Lentisphaerota bacterium]WET05304.1 peptide chain release factor-like protein [Lentisphaerota bacterium ZTH]